MVQISLLFVALAAVSVNGAPLKKRIAQVIAESTQQWEKACIAAGGGQQCNPLSVASFSTLLAAAGPCGQQDQADKMIDLAKQLNNDATMISLAQIFAQQPRNTPSSQSVPYCQKAPKNQQLNGLFQCQFQGADPQTFVGGAKVGAPGTIPFGQNKPLNPAGSCKANPGGPIPDGTQLVNIAKNPGVGGGKGQAGGNGNGNGQSNAKGNQGANNAPAGNGAANNGAPPPVQGGAKAPETGAKAPEAGANNAPAAAGGGGGGGGFKLQNGKDAQALNAEFEGLTAGSPCQDGDQACIDGGFAQCVGGKFAITQCSGGTKCIALPLVNKPGTSITCTTDADAEARIKATGATGGISG